MLTDLKCRLLPAQLDCCLREFALVLFQLSTALIDKTLLLFCACFRDIFLHEKLLGREAFQKIVCLSSVCR